VADAAATLWAIQGADRDDPATLAVGDHSLGDYRATLQPDGLRGARIGVAREGFFGYSEKADALTEAALDTMRSAGAVVVDPANLLEHKGYPEDDVQMEVLLYEFKAGIDRYLQACDGDDVPRSLANLIAFNAEHAAEELAYFGQEIFIKAQAKGDLTEDPYLTALATGQRQAREDGIDAVMAEHRLDALVMPTAAPACKIDLIDGDHILGGSAGPAAIAGYPSLSVPAGNAHGLPVGLTFMGRPLSESKLIRLAYAYECASAARTPPEYVPLT